MRWAVLTLLLSSLAQAETLQMRQAPPSLGPISQLLLLFGSFFILAASIGVFRFPDFYTRLHAATKLITLGGIGIFFGAAIAFGDAAITERILLITLFFFLTAPLSAYMIARAGYLRNLPPFQEPESVDEWGALGKDAQAEERYNAQGSNAAPS